ELPFAKWFIGGKLNIAYNCVDRVDAIGEQGITLKILGSVRAPDQWAAAGEYRKRLLHALDANGIDTPGRIRPADAQPSVPGTAR
ncbi:MAG TPA: acetyl-coenzyme A synthetase N-terminal domain-containing protein, partial [Candidatus Limnocylindrales bacterium]